MKNDSASAPSAATDRFRKKLSDCGASLDKRRIETLQIHLGKLCNMACNHCYAEASPQELFENMTRETAEATLRFLAGSAVSRVDLMGGAPELNPNFRFLILEIRARGIRVVDHCNLTVLTEPGMDDLPEFFASNGVEIVASLPSYVSKKADRQRGYGAFNVSIEMLRRLNRLGYGAEEGILPLHLVYNPLDPVLPPQQDSLETTYRDSLQRDFGVFFNRLYAMTNMPVTRYARRLEILNQYEGYLGLLEESFNPANLEKVMCRSTVCVGWDGRLYDCDFNQSLEKNLEDEGPLTVFNTRPDRLEGRPVVSAEHCLGCFAGAGSSCDGALQARES